MPDRNTAKPVPPLVPRTLRCANAALYAVSAVTLLAAGTWYVSTHENTAARVLAIAACLTGLLWAAYYCTLRITIDNQGVHRRTIFSQRSISWDFLSTWEIETSEDREQATCRLLFYSPDTPAPLIITSELFDLDAVRELAGELAGAPQSTPQGELQIAPQDAPENNLPGSQPQASSATSPGNKTADT